jgi:hypothetical protein
MADTDLPNGFGAIKPAPKPRPRPIASPFGIFPDPWATPDPNQAPGFNVQPPAAAQTNPMASLMASLPSGQDLKQGAANTLGAPVDALAWAAHRMGLPISGDVSYGGGGLGNTGIGGQPTWVPGPNVPFSSQYFQNAFDNPPSWDAIARALRRPGLF